MSSCVTPCSFGLKLKAEQFAHHDQSLIRLNNGSFGACPKVVLEEVQSLRNSWLSNPDDFWHRLESLFGEASNTIAEKLLGPDVKADDVFVMDNLTTAFATIGHSVIANIVEKNSVVVVTNLTYGAVTHAVRHSCQLAELRSRSPCETEAVSVAVVDLPFPLFGSNTTEQIIDAYRTTLNRLVAENKSIELVIIDHISSVPCVLMPVKELVVLCRAYGAKEILVDGAHGPGQVDLINVLPTWGIDYYIANLHKWCFTPATAAFMWVSPSAPSRQKLHHPTPSHNFGNGFGAEVSMLGTRDYVPMLSIPAALTFIDSIGGVGVIIQHNNALCAEAMMLLGLGWGTTEKCLPPQVCAAMGMVGCPPQLGDSWEASDSLRLKLREKNIVVQKFFPVKNDRLYFRVSAAVYNVIEDFVVLRDAVLAVAGLNA